MAGVADQELLTAQKKFPKGTVVLTTGNKIGVVEWLGCLTHETKTSAFIGIRLMEKKGNSNGTFKGEVLFECEEKFGLLSQLKGIRKKIKPVNLLNQLQKLQQENKSMKAEVAKLQAQVQKLEQGEGGSTDVVEGSDDKAVLGFLERELKKDWYIPQYDLFARYGEREKVDLERLYDQAQDKANKKFSSFQGADGHSRIVYCVASSPRDNLVASGSDDKTVRLWRRKDKAAKCIAKLQLRSCINAVAIRPDGNQLAAALDNGWVELWDLRTGKNMGALEGATSSEVWTVCYAPDGTMLISGALDRSVRIWDVKDKECKWALRGHEEWVNGVTVSQNGQFIVSGSGDKTVRTWDTRKMALLNTMKGHTNFVRSVAVVQNNIVCSAADDNTMRIWDLQTAMCKKICTEHTKGLYCVSAGNETANYVATASRDSTVKLWNVTNDSTKSIHTFSTHKGDVNSCAFLDNGEWLVSGSDDKTVCFNGPIREYIR